jgi:hypothetical protein
MDDIHLALEDGERPAHEVDAGEYQGDCNITAPVARIDDEIGDGGWN